MTSMKRIARIAWQFDPIGLALEAIARNPGRFLAWWVPFAIVASAVAEQVL